MTRPYVARLLRQPLLLLALLALLLPAWRPGHATAASEPLPRTAPAPVVQAAPAAQAQLPVVGQLGGASYTLVTSGTLVFQAEGSAIRSWNVADPAAPSHVSSLLLSSVVTSMQRRGTLLYVADSGRSLSVVDVSDPSAMIVRRRIPIYGGATGLKVHQGRAYVTSSRNNGSSRLQIFSLSDPTNPTPLGALWLSGWLAGLDVVGGRAYVAAYGYGVHIVDVRAPASMRRISTFLTRTQDYNGTSSSAYDVKVVNQRAYVAWGVGGLRIVDVANPASPTVVGALVLPGEAMDITIVGGMAYVASREGGLQIVKLESRPSLLGSAKLSGASSVVIVGPRAYVVDVHQGLHIYALDQGPAPVLLGRTESLGAASEVALSGSVAYVLSNHGLSAVDVRNPAKPIVQDRLALPEPADPLLVDQVLEVEGQTGYIALGNMLHIVDLSDPAALHISATLMLTTTLTDLQLAAGFAYLTYSPSFSSNWGGLYIVDVRDPAAPVVRSDLASFGGAVRAIEMLGDIAYLLTSEGRLRIVDVRNPDQPEVLQHYSTVNDPFLLDLSGSRLYVLGGWVYGDVLDVSIPEQPQEVTMFDDPLGTVRAFQMDGERLYAASGANGISILDMHEPATPVFLGAFNTPGYASDIVPAGDLIYVADGAGGLFILRNTPAQ